MICGGGKKTKTQEQFRGTFSFKKVNFQKCREWLLMKVGVGVGGCSPNKLGGLWPRIFMSSPSFPLNLLAKIS